MSSKEPRWKQFKKEKAAPAAGNGGMGLTANMAEQIAQENGVSSAELAEFAEFMDVDLVKEPHLLAIVAEAMKAPLPEFWIECEDVTTGQYYYCNTETRATTWEHPLDKYFKNLLWKERKNYKERAKQGHRPAQNGADVTTKAQDLYLKAQLEEKDEELNRLKTELEHSGAHDALRQLDKAGEARLLREQNSKLKKEVDNLRKDSGKKEKKGWFGKSSSKEDAVPDEASMRRVPDVEVGLESLLPTSTSTTDLPLMPPDSTRGTPSKRDLMGGTSLVDREWLWSMREGTRSLRHDLTSTRQEVCNLKMQLESETRGIFAEIKLQLLESAVRGPSAPHLTDAAAPDPEQLRELERLRERNEQLARELEQAGQNLARAEIDAAEAARAASESQALFGKAPPSPGTSASDAAELTDLRRRVDQGAAASKQLNEQLRAKQDEEMSVLAVLGDRGGGNLRAGVEALLDELRCVSSHLRYFTQRSTRTRGHTDTRTDI